MGRASLLENWILVGNEQGNFPVNAFVFLSILLQHVRNPFVRTRKEFCAMVAVNGITLSV